MFMAMLDGIKEESVGFLFNLEVKTKEEQDAEAKAKQDEAEAAALKAAQEGTARVLARQKAEADARAAESAAGNGQATATARRTPAASAAAAAPTAPAAPKPSGTGPELTVKGLEQPRMPENLQYSAPTLDGSAKEGGSAKAAKTATVTGSKEPARNAPCPCGSGKKYKFCHGATNR
jgi:preprotein translocase subunit SecA